MIAESNMPAIRFKRFSGEWEEKILGELVQLENGFAFKSKYFKKEPTDVIVLTPGSVNIGGGFQAEKGQYYDVKQDVPSKYVFKSGDMFITMTDLTPTAQALGFPAIVPNDDNTYLHNQRLGKLVGFEDDINFLFNLLSTPKKQKEVVLTSSGTTVKHTSPSKFLSRYSCFPKKAEQTKIGNYFQQLDTLIVQHQQKHDKLLNLKKALLEKMFPKQGATLPEIRFKGFSGEWEEKTLGELTDYKNGRGHEDKQKTYGKYELINLNSIAIDGGLKFSGKFVDEAESTLDKNDLVMILSDVAHGNLLGRVALIPVSNTYVLNQRVALLRPSSDIFPLFILYNINAHQPYFKAQGAGMSQLNISRSSVEKFSSYIPEKNEQAKIGNLFKQLDTLINQHQAQLKKLNNIKQACLEKMFV